VTLSIRGRDSSMVILVWPCSRSCERREPRPVWRAGSAWSRRRPSATCQEYGLLCASKQGAKPVSSDYGR